MDKIDQIREMLSRLGELTTEQLDELKGLIVAAFDEADGLDATTENVAICQELAEAGEAVIGQHAALEQAQAELEQTKASQRERIAKITGNADESGDAAEGQDAETEETEAEATADQSTEAVTASGAVRRMAGRQGRPAQSPEKGADPMRPSLVASAALGVDKNGTPITDRWQLAEETARILQRLDVRGNTGKVLIASAEWSYPEERQLRSAGRGTLLSDEDSRKMDAVTHPLALTASGGICAPVNVDWDMSTWATPERPVRDALPAFQASRGGLMYRQPPDFSALSGATAVWTEATDLNPGTSTKPVLAITCPSTTTVYVDAIPTRLGFGNMQARFDPEVVATNTDLSIVAAARIAEANLITRIQAAALSTVTTTAYLGASRMLLTTLDQFMAAFRDTHRLSDTQVVTALLPRWVKDMIRADRAMELAHDTGGVDPFAIPDSWIEDALSLRSINPIWHLDGLTTNVPSQQFAALANGALPSWPDKIYGTFFLEGSVQFLDGGRLDLGVVRDASLDATNDYEVFVETFEGIAFRGFANAAVNMTIDVVPSGASAGTVTPTVWA